ncbi:MAG: helix-turn-helix domain-containing protein, partial [Spirochaetia bacterium]|nr:helix-turn-helix domain-containing protein [Spirochaetia bacterium]
MNARFKTPASRWLALKTRDPRADGRFVYAVKTTGIFCRPTCPSKPALRRNVRFFENAETATENGFRACRRCRPDGVSAATHHAEVIERACRILENPKATHSLKELAPSVGMSVFHFHRLFKKTTGLTPKQYSNAKRASAFKKILNSRKSVTHSIYEAGFASSGRFYETSKKHLGMKPGSYRSGGKNEVIRYAVSPCALGKVLVAGTERGICAVRIGDSKKSLEKELRREFHAARFEKPDARFRAWINAVVRQVSDSSQKYNLPLDIQGTAF